MTITTDKAGIACCGNCGAHLEIVCKGGCEEPDVMFRKDYIASLPKPSGKETPRSQRIKKVGTVTSPPAHCTHKGCSDPVAPREPGVVGRPITQCIKHRDRSRQFRFPKRIKGAIAA